MGTVKRDLNNKKNLRAKKVMMLEAAQVEAAECLPRQREFMKSRQRARVLYLPPETRF
jgi:hypothetical protein